MHAVDDMTVFARVVERASLSAAGRELRLSPAVVSSRITKLEARLGVRLLNRTTRTVNPTEEGRLYYEHCLRILAEIAEVERKLAEKKDSPSGVLRVSAPTVMGRRWIAPLIPQFREAFPEVEIRLQLTDHLSDLVEEQVDVAIRRGYLQDSFLISRRVALDFRVACASPGYLEQHGTPATPTDLKDHVCLLLRFPGSRCYQWQFMEEGAAQNVAVAGPIDSNNSHVLIDWALGGAGIVMKSVWDLADEIEAGQLVPILQAHSPRDLAIHALAPPHRMQPPKSRAFINFIAQRLSKLPPAKMAKRFDAETKQAD
jgi:DNA-binding transcriptional LysR family regulator